MQRKSSLALNLRVGAIAAEVQTVPRDSRLPGRRLPNDGSQRAIGLSAVVRMPLDV